MLRPGFIIAITLASAGAARAQGEDPRPTQALTACASGDVQRGIDLLAALYAETREPAFVFNQGRCYQQNGQLEAAAQRFREYLRVGQDEPASDRQRAVTYIAEIEQSLARQRTALATPPPPEPENARRSLRLASFALAGISAATLGTGAVLSWRVRVKERQVERPFRQEPGIVEGSVLSRQLTDGGRLETWQYVAYGLGVATLAGAVTTFVLSGWPWGREPAVALAPVITPGGLGGTVGVRF